VLAEEPAEWKLECGEVTHPVHVHPDPLKMKPSAGPASALGDRPVKAFVGPPEAEGVAFATIRIEA
jgi:hypothetical protein